MRSRAFFLAGLTFGSGVALSSSASALDLSGGVSVGGMLAGVEPRLAVTPHVAVSWRADSGFLFVVRDMFSVLPAVNRHGVGIHNQLSAALGYGWETGSFSLGPAVSFYSMPACNPAFCGRIVGASGGGHAHVSLYLVGPLGVSASASVEWIGGNNGVLRDDVSATFLAGPVGRWDLR